MAGHFSLNMKLPEGLNCVECPEPVEGLNWVYILYCRNGSLYIGQSADVEKRLHRHLDGSGARHTKQLKNFVLVFTEGPLTQEYAIKRERQLKGWSRGKKLALIQGDQKKNYGS